MNQPEPIIRYRVDTSNWQVVEVTCSQGSDWPDCDDDGKKIFINTHFPTRAEALGKLRAEVRACVRLRGAEVEACRQKLREAERKAADAAVAFAKVHDLDGVPF